MAEITVDKAIALLSSDKQRDRSDGLADLKHILQKNKQSSKLNTLNDKACHKIFESLFRFISVEKSAYKRANSKGPSASRLSACASVLRTAVDVFLQNLRIKSVRAIIDHITETIPDPGEGPWEPLSVDYTKCLSALLHYPPHVEHLGIGEWEKLISFCLRGLGVQEDEDSQVSVRNSHRFTLDGYLDTPSRSTPSRATPVLAIREKHTGDKSALGEIVVCIQLLTASPTAPVQMSAEKIFHGLAEFVKSSHIAGSGQQAAFNSINTVVTKVLFDQSELVRTFLLDLIPVIRRLWATKLTGLKDELLVTIMLCMTILGDAIRKEPSEILSHSIQGLVKTLHSEYTRRAEKEMLQIDDLIFYRPESTRTDKLITGPRLGNAKSEHNWTLIWAIASLLELSEEIAARLSTPHNLEEAASKRQRFTSEIEEVFRDSFSSSGTKRLCALQLIPVLVKSQMNVESKASLLHRLMPNILDDNGAVSSWTMVAISSIASSPGADTPSLKGYWQQVWDLTSRASTSQVTSRAACNLMSSIMQFDLLEYSAVAETTQEKLYLEPFTRQDPNDAVVLDLLYAKSEMFLQAWRSLSEDKSHHVTVEIIQILASFCIAIALYTECLPQQLASRVADLQQNSQRLWSNVCSFLASREGDFIQPCLEMFSPILDSAPCLFDPENIVSRGLRNIVPPLAEILEKKRRIQNEFSNDEDAMDLDDPLSANVDQMTVNKSIINLNREALPFFPDTATFQRRMTIQLSILQSTLVDTYQVEEQNNRSLIEYLTALEEPDILSAQYFLPQVYRSCSSMDRPFLLDILEDLGGKCLESYGLERCESSQRLCISMLTNFVNAWTSGKEDHLSESAADLYSWFTDVLLAKGKASCGVLIGLSELLGGIISSNASYKSGQANPSPRTTLFMILEEGDILVKFSVANLIPRLFGRFSLQDHDAILNDVLESLPRDPDWSEGIALRLFILSQLASQWHTLLRRSIYHMFETPAQVPHSLWYAEKCMRDVANTLGLDNAKELFRLFSSQILYTWTESQSITLMPFSIFGYSDLRDMLDDVQDELVGQIIMRGNEQETAELSNFMNVSFVELLKKSFYRAEAYSISRDISTPPSQGSQPRGVENRLKKMLGTELFVTLIENQFPQVIATFFGSLDQYEQIEKAFSKRLNFQGALDSLKRITGKSCSQNALPANQQPSFRARYLLDELKFLCKRSGYDLDTIWTPALVSFVCRTLLESVHPALGSLHACSVIRKIRILVSVAGPVMLRDYPFEMILHALRPFLTDVYCSEDALGIFWYLLESGKSYLTESPGFMAGLTVSTFVSLNKFLASSPESTTQENQFMIVLEKLQGFLLWFGEFLDAYESSILGTDTYEPFRRLVRSAQKVSITGDNSGDTNERDLLLEILGDRNSSRNLLSKPIFDHVVSLLCVDFKRLPCHQYDNIETDEDAISNTVALCQTLRNFKPGTEYRLWAATVIGRGFAATGQISDVLLREQEPSLFQAHESRSSDGIVCHSKARIIQILCDMLQNGSYLEVGLVERTLQLIISNLVNSPEFGHSGNAIPPSLMKALIWNPYQCPSISMSAAEERASNDTVGWDPSLSSADWARNIALFLSKAAHKDPVVGPLSKVLSVIPGLAVELLPFILHDVLLMGLEGAVNTRHTVSEIFKQVLQQVKESTIPHARLVINCILYLRNQPIPDEVTIVERDEWLDINYGDVSSAANKCRMPKTSLLFLEIHASRIVSGSRRSSLAKFEPPPEIMHDVFRDIDDPDLFYGIQQSSSLESVMETLEYESSGLKNLQFQSAQYDSEIQMSGGANTYGVLKALNSTNLQGIANSMFTAPGHLKDTTSSFDSMLQAATSLRQWDIPVPPLNPSSSATVFRAFQSLNTSGTLFEVSTSIEDSMLTTLDLLASTNRSAISLRTAMRVLGIMTEINDVVHASSSVELSQGWERIKARNFWLKTTSVHEVGEILNCREALFSSIKEKDYLKSALNITDQDAQLLEVKAIRQSLETTRNHGISQASLKSAICLSKLAGPCASRGINIEGAAKFDLANVLWDQGEMTPSIRMLQQLNDQNDLHKQAIPISRAELLVTLGHHVAEARLEKPEAIIQQYLTPAVKELKGRSEGEEAGRVYHGFAMFCDQQLQNQDGLEDFKRVEQLRNRKEKEVLAWEEMMGNSSGRDREALKMYRAKAKQWFDLDDREYQRLLRSREAFLQQCLENYLLCLKESDTYNNDALRFCALWLDKSDNEIANNAVSKHLNQVPSRKFAPLMNQLSSRLLDVSDDFQSLLFALIFRICVEHPFHGMYQIFASSKSKGGKDQSSLARYRAAGRLVDGLKNDKRIGPTWVSIHNTNINYVRFAADRLDEKLRSGAKVSLKKMLTGQRLEQDAASQKLPPPTMKIDVRVDCNYSDIPKLVRFNPEFTIASGVSAPKIVTAIATDGLRYKQLFKGGNDDLRQDAIMEQVFEQVSSLLKDHQVTQQRNLGIRTYKVLPLTSNAGIIEFVPHTIPLHDYLMPAHQKYFPKDMKPNACRKHIADVQTRSFEQRVRTYRQVTERFHPVMKYFFMEKFNNPDDWFTKRLSYTRSTAAISILGHVLGLGDRHGHNILLDERTGEVVHIDLGVAFEQGRVLPVPEVVPFRLTRDLVDGMGITKTEGVFRRCCEFTLEALRQESYSIMTILDVLRYDPLYSWTVSPLRMKKMQDAPEAGDGPVLPGTTDQRTANEPSEADRALTVVAKKLSKTLSVTATVNELIQQATDEKNLAVLYCGWAAYA
ncbi:Serine/threonine-protein kinase tel1 [Aspergillus wentii]|nr:Serine/threonine-protein kinase tel1 [Aspergillus wentii]